MKISLNFLHEQMTNTSLRIYLLPLRLPSPPEGAIEKNPSGVDGDMDVFLYIARSMTTWAAGLHEWGCTLHSQWLVMG